MRLPFTIVFLIVTFIHCICQETNINLKNMSGRTEEFWRDYFDNKKDKGKYEGFYIEEHNYFVKSNGQNITQSGKVIIVEINRYNYKLLASGNHKFDYVSKIENQFEQFTIKGKRLMEPEDVQANDPIYYNFWGTYFEFITQEKFNARSAPCKFEVKAAKDAYYSPPAVSVGEIVGDKLIYTFENNSTKETWVLSSMFPKTDTDKNYSITLEWKSNGTGFLIDKSGYIATNYHVVKEANEIEIEINSLKYPAKVIVSDKTNDLAILKIDLGKNVIAEKALPYSIKTDVIDVGTSVFTLGYPFALSGMGKEIKFTDGKISSKTGLDGDVTHYQISVPIQGGNSGGPLFDDNGNIIGITASKIVSQDIDNVGYAIKASYLLNLIDLLPDKINIRGSGMSTFSLTEKVKIISPYIGIIKVR